MSYFQNLCYTSKIIPTQVWLPTKFLSDRVSLKVLSKKLIRSWRNLRHGKNKGQMLKPSNCSVKEVWCLLCQRGWIAHFLHFQTDRLLGRDLGWGPKWVNISRVQEKANVLKPAAEKWDRAKWANPWAENPALGNPVNSGGVSLSC